MSGDGVLKKGESGKFTSTWWRATARSSPPASINQPKESPRQGIKSVQSNAATDTIDDETED